MYDPYDCAQSPQEQNTLLRSNRFWPTIAYCRRRRRRLSWLSSSYSFFSSRLLLVKEKESKFAPLFVQSLCEFLLFVGQPEKASLFARNRHPFLGPRDGHLWKLDTSFFFSRIVSPKRQKRFVSKFSRAKTCVGQFRNHTENELQLPQLIFVCISAPLVRVGVSLRRATAKVDAKSGCSTRKLSNLCHLRHHLNRTTCKRCKTSGTRSKRTTIFGPS